ncbi:MAG: Rieske 2Fe-2S domain-containing protein [Pigmentiphaga sp.]|uniref:aromatic ring-hydroxylating oxygenase subunit alpha n=1 Tax=Pigmentiphaga sp. TaxID=1977564 RepID=UPI0029A68256|nr:Rieske 2Fe-2S domain-containing protein [Pigmentiphaga sp.]MDX3905742.1 Rieske 2Fe-2S domain-containing protein [Pigmentiphaga sp.]
MSHDLALSPPPSRVAPEDLHDLRWPDDPSEIPDWIYTDRRVYELEQQRIFGGRAWNYVGIDAELPNPGDYIRSYVGAVPVVVARDKQGQVHVFENRCAHRGAEFCKTYRGNTRVFTCPYHQWSFRLDGSLAGVPFRGGVNGKGGMPEDFDQSRHGLRKLYVTCRNGAIFASFSADTPPLEEYLGVEMLAQFDTIFSGRKLKLLGVHRNTLEGNWKLYQENLKDPYHATLLHTYLTTFGLFVAGNRTGIVVDPTGVHSALLNARPKVAPTLDEHKVEIKSFKPGMKLADERVLDFFREFDSDWSSSAMTIWPNLILLRQMNILSARQIVPLGPAKFLLVWTAFGYEDDSDAMTQHRLRQNNIFGPGGFLGIDDHEALKFVQDGLNRSVPRHGVAALGNEHDTFDTVITDRAIRLMYRHYRHAMGF